MTARYKRILILQIYPETAPQDEDSPRSLDELHAHMQWIYKQSV